VICLLLLRGPQTPGELRSRADRLYSFDDLEAVQSTLERLASRVGSGEGAAAESVSTGPLVLMLPRQPGSREARYAHLLGGPVAAAAGRSLGSPEETVSEVRGESVIGRLSRLEAEVRELRETVAGLERRLVEKANLVETANLETANPED
jgi:uncharacterized protein YceH (UPF0502 family)